MLWTTILKFRRVSAFTSLPRLLRGNYRYGWDRFENVSGCVLRKGKSTKSGQMEEEDESVRLQRIIDKAFGPPDAEPAEEDLKLKTNLVNIVSPEIPRSPETHQEKCQRIINEIFGEDNTGDRKSEIVDPIDIPITELQATTAKEHVETLAQKIEQIEETPLVEAPAKSKIEGFNVHPKVLGQKRRRVRTAERLLVRCVADKGSHGRRRGNSKKDGSFDELAKRCLDSPSSHIDERLLKEMEKLGVPSSRRGSKRTANDAGIVQPEIMRKPRRPVEKTELDYLTMKRVKLSKRLNYDFPPPFELTPSKIRSYTLNIDSGFETKNASDHLHLERMPPHHLQDRILSDVAMPDSAEHENLKNHATQLQDVVTHAEENPPQQLLGQMTAAVMSEESAPLMEKRDKKQEQLEPCHYMLGSSGSRAEVQETDDDKFTLSRLKEFEEQRETPILHDELTPTNILSKLVDPKDISPPDPEMLKEYKDIEMLRNLLRTRIEYLTQEKVTRLHPKYDDTSNETVPYVDKVLMKEFTESEVDDTLQRLGIESLKADGVKPCHLKEDLTNNTSKFTEPSVMVKDFDESRHVNMQPRETQLRTFQSYSETRGLITPHEFFEELALLSRETEIGVVTDEFGEVQEEIFRIVYSDSRNVSPSNQTAGHVLPNEGISKDTTTFDEPWRTSHVNVYEHMYSVNNVSNVVQGDESMTVKPHNTMREPYEIPEIEQYNDDPVIAAEMSRLWPPAGLEPRYNINMEPAQNERRVDPEAVAREASINPLLDKSTVAPIEGQNLDLNVTSTTSQLPSDLGSLTEPKENIASNIDEIPLSELLRRVRERNRREFCREFELRMATPEVDPLVGKCKEKKSPCPPPAPTCPPPAPVCPPPVPKCPPDPCPPPKPPCPPPKPPCPDPCKPKCPPTSPPCESKPKCPPPKKSPCEKFKPCKCTSVQIQDALTLLLYLGPQLHIPQKSMLPFLVWSMNGLNHKEAAKTDRIYRSFTNLCGLVLMANIRDEIEALQSAVRGKDCSRTYDPWSPIPSWPIPVKEKKKKLVCPKDGCKVMPPKPNAPCPIPACQNFPKKHFSIVDLLSKPLRQKKVVFDIEE